MNWIHYPEKKLFVLDFLMLLQQPYSCGMWSFIMPFNALTAFAWAITLKCMHCDVSWFLCWEYYGRIWNHYTKTIQLNSRDDRQAHQESYDKVLRWCKKFWGGEKNPTSHSWNRLLEHWLLAWYISCQECMGYRDITPWPSNWMDMVHSRQANCMNHMMKYWGGARIPARHSWNKLCMCIGCWPSIALLRSDNDDRIADNQYGTVIHWCVEQIQDRNKCFAFFMYYGINMSLITSQKISWWF